MMINKDEHFLPNATMERENRQYEGEDDDSLEHGVNVIEFPSDTAVQLAVSKLARLDDDPLTAYITTHDFHDFLLAMQHWLSKSYFIGDSSAIVCTEHFQSAKLFRPLF